MGKGLDERLLRNFFFKPGLHQISNVYKKTKSILVGDQTWFGISYFQKRIGDYEPKCKVFLILLAPVFLPLWLLSIPEIIIRYIFGFLFLISVTIISFLIITFSSIMLKFSIPLFKLWQEVFKKVSKRTFRCNECQREYEEPYYECPRCGNIHEKLTPGLYGIINTNCAYIINKADNSFVDIDSLCNKKLSLYMTGKDDLHNYNVCPHCKANNYIGTSENHGIQLVGASNSGKTAFLAAFWHIYFKKINGYNDVSVALTPQEVFEQLEDSFISGVSEATSEKNAISYSVEHVFNKCSTSITLTVYDIAGEAFDDEDYEITQEQYKYCDGIIIVIDPLNSTIVRSLYQDKNSEDLKNHSETSPDVVVSSFIGELKKQKRFGTNKVDSISVSVVITKADVKEVKKAIGMTKIKTLYNNNSEQYKSFDEARNVICKEYLESIDFGDVVNILEANFNNVCFFPVSAMGHNSGKGKYEPYGVVEAVERLLHSRIRNILTQ